MGYPALIGATAPDDGFTVRYLHWSDHPDHLVPKLRQIWSDTFDTDTATMVDVLLAQDWSSLSPHAGSTGTAPPLTIAGVGTGSGEGSRPDPYTGRIATADNGDMEWLYLIDRDTDSIRVYAGTLHGRWVWHSVHWLAPADPSPVLGQDATTSGDGEEATAVLEPGAIVTVTSSDVIEEPPGRLFVVIDGFAAPRYTIAVLGGDGFQYPNVPVHELTTVMPAHIVLDPTTDGGYVTG